MRKLKKKKWNRTIFKTIQTNKNKILSLTIHSDTSNFTCHSDTQQQIKLTQSHTKTRTHNSHTPIQLKPEPIWYVELGVS